MAERKRIIEPIWIGGVLFILGLIALIWIPDTLGGVFDAMAKRVEPIVVKVFIGPVGVAIIISVTIGRLLERLGFTDALIRLFLPVMRLMGINSAVIVPAIYNMFGDINAAGRIAGPVLVQAKATTSEQKMAVALMVNLQQSFSTFMLGLLAMTLVKAPVFLVVVLSQFVPLFVIPLFLKYTFYRDTKQVELKALPRFTPEKPFLTTIFGGAVEGANLLFLLIIPAVAVIFALIGGLEFFGAWKPIEEFLGKILGFVNIDTKIGLLAILASPTAAMGLMSKTAASLTPQMVAASFVLAASGLPLSVIFGQIPAIWKEVSELNEREAILAACLGTVLRFFCAILIGLIVAWWVS